MSARSPIERMIDQAVGYTPAAAPAKPPAPLVTDEAASAVLLTLADAAKTWWEELRPADVSADDHLELPTMGCANKREKNLARAVAEWVRVGG